MPAVDSEGALWAAVDAFDESLPALTFAPEAAERARDSLEETGLLLLGEVHGVRENPLLVRELVRFFGIGALALELSPAVEPVVTGLRWGSRPSTLPAEFWAGDGRVNAGSLAVLDGLATRRADVTLTLMDGADAGARPPRGLSEEEADRWLWSYRDASMAQAVLRDLPAASSGMLVVAGSLHAALEPGPHGRPLGAELAAVHPGVATIDIVYGSGAFYNFGPRTFEPREPDATAGLRLRGNALELVLPVATEATVPHR